MYSFMPMRKAHLKRKAEAETFGLENIGLVSPERTNAGDNKGDVSLDKGPSWENKRMRTPIRLSREVFTVEHAGLLKLEMRQGEGEMAPSSFIRSSTPLMAKQAMAVKKDAKNSVIFGITNKDLKETNFPVRVLKRGLSTTAACEGAAGSSPRTPGQNSLQDPGEAHLKVSQTLKHVEVLTLESSTHEQGREINVTSPKVQEADCTSTGATQTTSTGLSEQLAEPFKTREYQTEMFLESLRRNIILCVSANL